MRLLISTNMYEACEFQKVFEITKEFPEGEIGIEIFPMFHDTCYEALLEASLDRLRRMPISFHGPYFQAEHSAKKGSREYEETISYVSKTLCWAGKMNCRYYVFHHNNCRFFPGQKEELLLTGAENLEEISSLCAAYQIPVAVENAGVKSRGNMLLEQQEFVDLCRELKKPVLIDIGHAYANGWNLREVMEDLQKQIISYHVHNNDGFHDSHRRIFDGALDMEIFLRDYEELTPEADFVLEYSREVSADTDGIKADVRHIRDRLQHI